MPVCVSWEPALKLVKKTSKTWSSVRLLCVCNTEISVRQFFPGESQLIRQPVLFFQKTGLLRVRLSPALFCGARQNDAKSAHSANGNAKRACFATPFEVPHNTAPLRHRCRSPIPFQRKPQKIWASRQSQPVKQQFRLLSEVGVHAMS